MHYRLHLTTAIAALSIFAIADSATAQITDEIIVTATKKATNIQDTAISITAYTGEAIQKLGLENSVSFAAQTPGLNVGTPVGEGNNPTFVLRGVGLNDFNDNNEGPIAIYTDEVYNAALPGLTFQLFDVDRVEVLRGPQGTLYGRNATGGLLHFVSKRGGDEFEDTLEALNKLLTCDVMPNDVAAMVVEPVQGEGGFYPASDEFLKAIRSLCDEHGIVMIADEIQTGFGRTGKFFCMEHSGVEPDLITTAKGMAGGYPIAAVIGKAEIMDAPAPGGLGGTYAGSPVGCAAPLAVIDVMEEENLTERSNHIGRLFETRLTALKDKHPEVIGDVRCSRGAMIAVEFVHDGDANKPNADLVGKLVSECYANGLVVLKCGIRNNVFRFLPALNIPDKLVKEGLDIFEKSLKNVIN